MFILGLSLLLSVILGFSQKVFFLGFSLLFFSCFLVLFVWNFVSQWLGLIFFLVYMTGVIVMFIFFCSFSSNVGGLVFNSFICFSFFFLFNCLNSSFLLKSGELKNISESSNFYFMSEVLQLILLGIWLVFILWSSVKIINMLGGVVRSK